MPLSRGEKLALLAGGGVVVAGGAYLYTQRKRAAAAAASSGPVPDAHGRLLLPTTVRPRNYTLFLQARPTADTRLALRIAPRGCAIERK
jgi:hypothetical protein